MTTGTRSTPKPHHAYLSLLKLSLMAGAAYDVIFATAMLVFPAFAAGLLGLRLPGDPYYLWLIAVFLMMLAGFYLLAAYDPRAYSGNIVVGIVGRVLGFFAMLIGALLDPTLPGLYLLAFADLTFALLHFAFWWPIRR